MDENKNLLKYFIIGWIFIFFIISPINLFAKNSSSTTKVDGASNQPRYWISLEYLAAQGKGRPLPPIVITAPSGTPIANMTLNNSDAEATFGDDEIGGNIQNGVCLDIGHWLTPSKSIGIGLKLFGFESDDVTYLEASAGDPIIAIPFFNSAPGINDNDSLLVAFPGVSSGQINIISGNDFWGFECSLRAMLGHGRNYEIYFIGGYQFNRIQDNLEMRYQINSGAATYNLSDTYETDNIFNGALFGISAKFLYKNYRLDLLGKVAVGNMEQNVKVDGYTATTVGGNTTTTGGGLFSGSGNSGSLTRNRINWVPEFNGKLSYFFSESIELSVGYRVMYWNNIVMSGDQIETTVNGTGLFGGVLVGPEGSFNVTDTNYYVQAISFNIKINF